MDFTFSLLRAQKGTKKRKRALPHKNECKQTGLKQPGKTLGTPNVRVTRFGSVRLRFGDRTVRAVPVFGSGGSSKEGVFVCFSTVSQRGLFRFRFFRFLENGSGGSGSAFGSCKNGSDGSGFRFRFGSWATLQCH